MVVLGVTLNGMNRNQPLIDWANMHPDKVPPEEMQRPAKEVVVDYSSAIIWANLGSGQKGLRSDASLPSFAECELCVCMHVCTYVSYVYVCMYVRM